MKRYLDYKKVLITADNYTDYVEMDSIIVEKWKKGIINNTKFSNSLRLELLVKYGGIWIDNRNDITQAAGQPPPLVFQYEDEKQ